MAALFAFLHHVSAFTLFAALVVEFVLIRGTLTVESARKIQRADMILGISAGVLLLVGLARVFYFEKGATYYFHTWTFHAKLTLFVIVALDVDHSDPGVPALAYGSEGGTGARGECRENQNRSARSSTTRWWAWC